MVFLQLPLPVLAPFEGRSGFATKHLAKDLARYRLKPTDKHISPVRAGVRFRHELEELNLRLVGSLQVPYVHGSEQAAHHAETH